MKEMVRLLKQLTVDGKISKKKIKQKTLGYIKEMEESLETLSSSSKLLEFCVHDMLSLAQINNPGKFRKNCTLFNIKEAVREVMEIQKSKADYQCIELNSHFSNFEGNFMVCTDYYRLQQVLLNF